jgi:hypothetical protein
VIARCSGRSRSRRNAVRWAAGLAALCCASCELQEVTLAEAGDAVIAEVILRAGESRQLALLHRTLGTVDGPNVPGAVIEVRDGDDRVMAFRAAPDEECLDLADDRAGLDVGSCYESLDPEPFAIEPGGTYSLAITLRDGGRLEGLTTVPESFRIVTPPAVRCAVPVDSTLEMVWTTAPGVWVYIAEASLAGIRDALVQQGIDVPRDPLRLFGLAVTAEDTTIVFPTEFGVFDRADPELGPVLLAIRDGLPPGVTAEVIIAAADRNYVNWARGGNFNPSGLVRIPSVTGDGTGVFGSMVPLRRRLESGSGVLPRCGG